MLGSLAVAWALTACSTTPTGEDDQHVGLVEVQTGNFDEVYMAPERDLPVLAKVAMAQPEVVMNEQWLRRFRGDYTSRDLARIKSDYGRFLQESLAESLGDAGVEIVREEASPTLILRPRLRQLNIYAPDLTPLAFTDQYIETAGSATVDLEFIDPATGRVLAQFVDHREAPAIVYGQVEETNRAINNRLFKRLMDRWSRNLVNYLEQEGSLPAAN